MNWIPDSVWNQALGKDGNRMVVTYDKDLGAIVAVVAPDGSVLSSGSSWADGKHRNHPCIRAPRIDS